MKEMAGLILASDKRQSNPETRRNCPIDPEHGGLLAHGSGAGMMCTARGCEHREGLERGEDE